MSRPNVSTASISNEQFPAFLTQKLRPALPYSLPLYRRCQFHLKTVHDSKHKVGAGHPELWIARIDKTNEPCNKNFSLPGPSANMRVSSSDWLSSWLEQIPSTVSNSQGPSDEWLAAHINLSNQGETQIWTFGSWEPHAVSDSEKKFIVPDHKASSHIALFRALFHHLRTHHIPTLSLEPPEPWLNLLSAGKWVSKPYSRTKILFGAIAGPLWPYLQDDVVYGDCTANPITGISSTTCIARKDQPYLKYIMPLDKSTAASLQQSAVPDDLRFGPLTDAHLQLMLDRSPIPRTLALLKILVSVGLFARDNPNPIAWGMLSKDASIGSLHTEPEYRGRGLAECVSRELIRAVPQTYRSRYARSDDASRLSDGDVEKAENDDNEVPYVHADVSPSNKASRRVFEKLGGTVEWQSAWIEVDLRESV